MSPTKIDREKMVIRISSFANRKHRIVEEEQGTLVEEPSHETSSNSDSDDDYEYGGKDITVKYETKKSISVCALGE
jgi:hypothetical protein